MPSAPPAPSRPRFAADGRGVARLLAGSLGLAGLASITLLPNGTSRMHAAPWSLGYQLCLLAPPALLLLRLAEPGRPLRLPSRLWTAAALAAGLLPLVSALASPVGLTALAGAWVPFSALCLFLLTGDWLASAPEDNARHLGTVLALAAAALMESSLGLWIGGMNRPLWVAWRTPELWFGRNPHPLGHANYTAGLALLSLPWLTHAAGRARGWRRGLWAVGAGLGLLVLFGSGSRGGLLGLVVLGFAALSAARLGWKKTVACAFAATAAVLLLAVANPRIRSQLAGSDPGAAPSASSVQREAMLLAGVRMGADRPWLGWGPESTPRVFPRYRAGLAGGAEDVLQLHCTPVAVWAELGGLGVLAFGLLLILALAGARRAPVAAVTLAGYAAFALTDAQLDVPVFAAALALLAALLAAPGASTAAPRIRLFLAGGTALVCVLLLLVSRPDPAPELNVRALLLAADPAKSAEARRLLEASLQLDPAQEIAHFNLGWLLVVSDPAAAEAHFLAAARLVPDKGGVYFGLGLSRLNQGRKAEAARAFAVECLNDPSFLASPWWTVPALAELAPDTRTAFVVLTSRAAAALPARSWARAQAEAIAGLAPRLGVVSAGPEAVSRRERTGYPVLMRQTGLPAPLDLYVVREDPRFAASVTFTLPAKGWLPSPLLLNLAGIVPSP